MKCNRGKYNAGGMVNNPNGRMTDEQKREKFGSEDAKAERIERDRYRARRANAEEMKYGKDGMKARSDKAVQSAIKKLKGKNQ